MLETPSFAHGSARLDCATGVVLRAVQLADFVAGEENRAAQAAVEWLLDEAGSPQVGPLVLHGPSGIGKTHLVRGLAEAWSARRPGDVCEIVTGAEWNEAYVAAVDGNRISEFRRRFRECDLLVIDELHRLGSKPAAQTELTATLDALENRGSAVALSSISAPAKTEGLQVGLLARLSGGVVVELTPPSNSSRRVILDQCVRRRGWTVDSGALEILANDRSRSVPEMIGTLTQWQQTARVASVPLDAVFVRKQNEHSTEDAAPTLRNIAEQTARRFGLTVAELKSESRRRTIVTARDAAMLLARRLAKKSFSEIGAYFGGRDHTTVMHSCRKVEDTLDHDPDYRALFAELRQTIERNCSG